MTFGEIERLLPDLRLTCEFCPGDGSRSDDAVVHVVVLQGMSVVAHVATICADSIRNEHEMKVLDGMAPSVVE